MRRMGWLALAIGCGSSGQVSTNDGSSGDGSGSDGQVQRRADGGGTAAACGNGTRECGEECDDGNKMAGDGCDASCRIEPFPGAPQSAVDALHALNALRARACERGSQIETHVVAAAQNH